MELTPTESKTWKNVELNKQDTEYFRDWLILNHIPYESSECGNLTHFECYVTEEDTKAANEFLNTL